MAFKPVNPESFTREFQPKTGNDLLDRINIASSETEQRIQERGTIQSNVAESFKKALPGGGEEGKINQAKDIIGAGLQIPSAPFRAIESSIANTAINLQDPTNLNFGKLMKDAASGASLQRQGTFEDVFLRAGLPETPSQVAGFATSLLIPIGIVNKLNKTFGAISKASDKGILKAGDDIIKSIDDAVPKMGSKVDEVFDSVKSFTADKNKFIDDFLKLPEVVQNKAGEVFGNMDDFANKITIGRLREFKRWVGKLRQTSFGKEAKGVAETLDDAAINSSYAGLKSNIKNSVEKTIGGNEGSKISKIINDAEEGFTSLKRASDFLKRTIVDPTLKLPTKAGILAGKLKRGGDVTARTAANVVKSASKEANKSMTLAVDALNIFSRNKALAQIFKQIGKGLIIGGAAGAVSKKLRNETDVVGGNTGGGGG